MISSKGNEQCNNCEERIVINVVLVVLNLRL